MISRLFAILVLLTFASTTAQAQIGRQGGPMDITSDRLEVIDAENKAVFSGNVDAAQGDTRLRADQIEVFGRKHKILGVSARPNINGASNRDCIYG